MPELPEVETVRRGLAPAMVGARIVSVEQRRPDLRFPFPKNFAARLTGRTITALDRRAKYLLADLSSGETLVMHLGMTGRFLVAQNGAAVSPGDFHFATGGAQAHDHVVFHLSTGAAVTYNDARRFGFMDLVPRADLETCRHFAGLGLEPLGDAFVGGGDRAAVSRASARRSRPRSSTSASSPGLATSMCARPFFRAGLHPEAPAGSLADAAGEPTEAARRLAEDIRAVLHEAVAAGGSTLRDYAQTDGSLGYFQHAFRVYDRAGEPCVTPDCAGAVTRVSSRGARRSTAPCAKRARTPRPPAPSVLDKTPHLGLHACPFLSTRGAFARRRERGAGTGACGSGLRGLEAREVEPAQERSARDGVRVPQRPARSVLRQSSGRSSVRPR